MFLFSCHEWTLQNVFIRIMMSVLLGCLIGLDRGAKRRGTGARTSFVICLASTLVMLTAQYIDIMFPGKSDLSRMAAQVISGVGFLGVGTIIISKHQVKGLTTAASLWSCACIGLATGIGLIDVAVLVTFLMLLMLHVLPIIEHHVYKKSKYFGLYIELEGNEFITSILEACKQENIQIEDFDIINSKAKGQSLSLIATIRIPDTKKTDYYLNILENTEGVISLDTI